MLVLTAPASLADVGQPQRPPSTDSSGGLPGRVRVTLALHTTAMATQPLKGPVPPLLSKTEQGLENCVGEGKGP